LGIDRHADISVKGITNFKMVVLSLSRKPALNGTGYRDAVKA
jgi:hypothetical protein